MTRPPESEAPGAAVGAAARAQINECIEQIKGITPGRRAPNWLQVQHLQRSVRRTHQLQALQDHAARAFARSGKDPQASLTRDDCDSLRAAAKRHGHSLTWVRGSDGQTRWMLTVGARVLPFPGLHALREYLDKAQRVVSAQPGGGKRR